MFELSLVPLLAIVLSTVGVLVPSATVDARDQRARPSPHATVSSVPVPAGAAPATLTTPQVRLTRTTPLEFPALVDSNSPAFWRLVDGVDQLHVMNSYDGLRQMSRGPTLDTLTLAHPATCTTQCDGRRWLEAILQDGDGTLYGYYHGEPNRIVCEGVEGKTAPRIGASRSRDGGRTWEDLGIFLEAPAGTEQCETPNQYFVGGFGDVSAILDRGQTWVYFFFSAYVGEPSQQGVVVARMLWADRDLPVGNVAVWDASVWRYPSVDPPGVASVPSPLYPASVSWHDPSGRVDAFWGPSVHWNTYLEQYVMLLNRAADSAWTQEGIYVAFSPVLDDPSCWTVPYKILSGAWWYPQVMGLERGAGTDKMAGQVARFFTEGRSEYLIVFERGR